MADVLVSRESAQLLEQLLIDNSGYIPFRTKRLGELRAALAAKPVEPFGYWHQADDPDECDFRLASDVSGNCDRCIPLYLHTPAEQDKENGK